MTLNFFLVGKSHASHFEEAYDYYKKRLLKYAKVNIIALKESKLPDKPSQSQIDKALEEESKTILNLREKENKTIELLDRIDEIDETGKTKDSINEIRRIWTHGI